MPLLHGDCLDLLPTIASDSIDMVFADLPYGVTHNKWDAVIPFGPLWHELLRVGKPNCAFVFTATQPFASKLLQAQPKLFRYELVWQKHQGTDFANAKQKPLAAHENILVFSRATCNPMSKMRMIYNPQTVPAKPYTQRRGRVSSNNGSGLDKNSVTINDGFRYPLSVLAVPTCREKLHPTQKPVALLEWLIRTYTHKGHKVLDPTAGSGTTAVAAINTGRNYICIEKDPGYYATATKRIRESQPPEDSSGSGCAEG